MKRIGVFAIALLASTGAFAQVISIGPFAGTASETFETYPSNFYNTLGVMGGAATMNRIGTGQGMLVAANGWSFFSLVTPHGGNQFIGGAGDNYEYVFTTPALRFGGYFATNANAPDATVAFYDANNFQIGTALTASAPMGQWAWNGWQYAGGIGRVVIRANNQFNGFIMNDDMQYTAVPEPATLAAFGLGVVAMLRKRRRTV